MNGPATAIQGRPLRRLCLGSTSCRCLERCATTLLIAAVLLACAVGAAAVAGYRTQVVLTGSMQPALEPRDMVIVRSKQAADVRPGQIISFAHPTQEGVVMTHRVRSMRTLPGGKTIRIATQGDANRLPERWSIAATGGVGLVVGTVPGGGTLTSWTGTPSLRIGIFGFLGAALLFCGLRWAWRQ